MQAHSYPVPANESRRLHTLHDYDILDTITEKEYDFITMVASQICNTPVSLITLLDKNRQWIKSHFGINIKETPREFSFCNYTILDANNVTEVPDLRIDSRFSSNPLVTGVPNAVFYAGAPLVTPRGFVLGSICVLDSTAKVLTEEQKNALKALAQQAITTMELRKKNKDLKGAQQKLKKTNKNLKEFARMISHDMKTPLANITMLTKDFRKNYKCILDEYSDGYMELIEHSATELIIFIDRLLDKTEKTCWGEFSVKPVDTFSVLNKVIQFLATPDDIVINITGDFPRVHIDETALQQVFQNLITNAIKYNDKPEGIINIMSNSDNNFHYFHVSDNGSGIATKDLEKIFRKQQTLNKTDRYGNKGTGIGLAKVKSIIESAGGKITVTSRLNAGTNFKICIPQYRDIQSA